MSQPQCSFTDIVGALKALCIPGCAIEVRGLSKTSAPLVGFFNDPVKAANEICNRDHEGVMGWYVTINPLPMDMLARIDNRLRIPNKGENVSALDADILYRSSFTLDIDPKRDNKVSSSHAEHEAALNRAQHIALFMQTMHGWSDPDIIDSGNGAHVRWPIRLDNNPDSATLCKNALAWFAAKFDDADVHIDGSVFNASRIFRIPGTVARKGEHIEIRPWRLCQMVVAREPLGALTRAQLVKLTGEPDDALPAPSPSPGGPTPPLSEPKYRSLNRKALDRLDEWVPSMFPDARQSSGGYRWSSADIGRDLEEDIVFRKSGIKDFGVHDLGDPTEGRRSPTGVISEYITHGDSSAAANILSFRLGVEVTEFGPISQPLKKQDDYGDPNEAIGSAGGFSMSAEMANYMMTSDDMLETYDELPFMHTGWSQFGLANWRIAGPKTGKTVLVYEEALRGVLGVPLFGGTLPCETKADWALIYAFEDTPKASAELLRRQYREICKETDTPFSEEVFKDIRQRIRILCPESREYQSQVKQGKVPDMVGGDFFSAMSPLVEAAKQAYGPNGIVIVDTFEEMMGFMNGMAMGIAELDMAKARTINNVTSELGVCMLVTHHMTKGVSRNQGGDLNSYISGTFGLESKLNNYMMLKGPTDEEYRNGIKDIHIHHKTRLRDLDDKWFKHIPKKLRPQGHIFLPIKTVREPGSLSDDAEAIRAMMIEHLDKAYTVRTLMAACYMGEMKVKRGLAELEVRKRILAIAKTPQYAVYVIENSPAHSKLLVELKMKKGGDPSMGLPDVL